jgi:hypothetical protein
MHVLLTFHFAQRQTGTFRNITNYEDVRRNTPEANRIFDIGLRDRNLMIAGLGLHLLEDSYSHEGYSVKDWLNSGHATSNIFWYSPDIPNLNNATQAKALDMAVRVNERLGELATRLGRAGGRFSAEQVRNEFADIWRPRVPTTGKHSRTDTRLESRTEAWRSHVRRQLGEGELEWGRQRFEARYQGDFDAAVDRFIPEHLR